MSKEQSDGDLLPYREVDRTLKPKLPLLAGVMGVTPQHALGSLIEFWDMCADPRELESIASLAITMNQTPEVVLAKDDLELKFEIASGKKVEAIKLVALRLLEPRPNDTFRVRGMSRDFKPIVKRLVNKKNAAEGGRKSAETRAAAHGTAQPKGGKGSKDASAAGSEVAQALTEAPTEAIPKRAGSDDGSAAEAERNPSGQRSAVSDTSSSYDDDGAPPPPSLAVQFFGWFQAARAEGGWAHEEPPPGEELEAFFATVTAALKDDPPGATEALKVAMKGYSKDEFWLGRALPWAGFVEQWARHVRKPRSRMLVTNTDDEGSA